MAALTAAISLERLLPSGTRVACAVGLLTGSQPLKAVTYSLSVWTGEEHLRGFLRAPDHADLMRRYRPRLLDVRSVVWETADLRPAELWREGLARLG